MTALQAATLAFLGIDLAVAFTAITIVAGLAFMTFMVFLALGDHLPGPWSVSITDTHGESALEPSDGD